MFKLQMQGCVDSGRGLEKGRVGGGDNHSTDTDIITYTACSLYSLLVLPDVNHLDRILTVSD